MDSFSSGYFHEAFLRFIYLVVCQCSIPFCCWIVFHYVDITHFLFFFLINLFIYFWLCWVFVSVRGLSLVAASGGHSSSQCAGLSLSQPLLLRSTGSRRAGSAVVAHGRSCPVACGILPDRGSNPCPLHWQADFQPLSHQGSPNTISLSIHLLLNILVAFSLGLLWI